VQGPKGQISRDFHPLVALEHRDGALKVERTADTKAASAMHGMTRALAANMVHGVASGFERRLKLVGVGYRATVAGNTLTMNLGYMFPCIVEMPEGVIVRVEANTEIILESVNNEVLGNVAAVIRGKRPPEPYKGKGVRYADERIVIKPGKSGKK
jgi:large subunit ribosomal protein L6